MTKLQELEQRKADAEAARDRIQARRQAVADWQGALKAERDRLQADDREPLLRRVALGEAEDSERQAANRRLAEIGQDEADAKVMAELLEREFRAAISPLGSVNEQIDDIKRQERDREIKDVAKRMQNEGHTGRGLLEAIQAHVQVDRQELRKRGIPV